MYINRTYIVAILTKMNKIFLGLILNAMSLYIGVDRCCDMIYSNSYIPTTYKILIDTNLILAHARALFQHEMILLPYSLQELGECGSSALPPSVYEFAFVKFEFSCQVIFTFTFYYIFRSKESTLGLYRISKLI